MTPSRSASPQAQKRQFPPSRIILLLDLDCFYAACERVRLNLPPATTSLALLQWNSVLAVTYPARTKYGIKRGDTWEEVRHKSSNECLALHLPLLQMKQTSGYRASLPTTASELVTDETTEQAYEREYHLTDEQRQQVLDKELNVRRYNHEGKACLERYRIASGRIFGVVLQTLQQTLGEGNFVLERASIDELFFDVTRYCWEQSISNEDSSRSLDEAVGGTVMVGNNKQPDNETHQNSESEDDPSILRALHYGCLVAYRIRQAVLDILGFTLSAGISTSKLLAKLGASYGKPNGQALIRPSCVPFVMSNTTISKVRNLGGKIGKQVEALLPPNEPRTMGSIAQCLSLPMLSDHLGQHTGRMVFDACRGVDREDVRHTVGALVKSITAFKSFPKTSITSGEFHEWLILLATEVVSRVRLDSQKNERYPKSCTIQYATSNDGGSRRNRGNRSLRIPFPADSNQKSQADTVSNLVDKTKDMISTKEGRHVWLIRAGFCAMDFQPRLHNGGISLYFSERGDEVDEKVKSKADRIAGSDGAVSANQNDANDSAVQHEDSVVDRDHDLARKLQASYDREEALFTASDKRAPAGRNKKARIDSFFAKKK